MASTKRNLLRQYINDEYNNIYDINWLSTMIHLNDYDLQLDVLFQEVIITQGDFFNTGQDIWKIYFPDSAQPKPLILIGRVILSILCWYSWIRWTARNPEAFWRYVDTMMLRNNEYP